MKKTLMTCAVMFVFAVTMLLGTTYAWWSETIVVDENIIQMGNLDLTVELADPEEWVDGEIWYDLQEYTTTGIFETTKTIQPGSTDSRLVKVTNTGSIPLAFRVVVLVDEANALNEFINFEVFYDTEVYVYDGALVNLESDYVVLQPNEGITFTVSYTVDPTLGDVDGTFGEGLSLPFTVKFEAEQVGKVLE